MQNFQLMMNAIQWGAQLMPFVYQVDYLPATASVTTNGQFVVEGNSAFVICETEVIATDASNVAITLLQPFGTGVDVSYLPFLIQMTDQGSGRSLQSSAVPCDSWFGTGARPFHWSTPMILNAQSTFTIALQNLSASDRNVRLSFNGFKVFGQFANFTSKFRLP